MENAVEPIKEESYEEIKRKAQAFYRTLNRIWCPAVDDYIVFNMAGFGHLVRKGNMMRPKSEQKRRFALLPYIAGILKNPGITAAHEQNTILHTAKINGKRIAVPSIAHFWRIVELRDGSVIKIVIRQIEPHEKHFFNIFAGKQKSTP